MVRSRSIRIKVFQLLLACALVIPAWGTASAQSVFAPALLLPGDSASSPAAGRQDMPQIAKGGPGSLLVWADNRSSLQGATYFSGPYGGTGLGTMTDIYAARQDATGRLIDTTPIIVSQARYNQTFPQVAWNGRNWLVAWATERATSYYHTDIVGVRIAPDGQVLDQTPILINSAETSIDHYQPWRVVSDGTNWTVIWRDLDPSGGIITIDGARIGPDGTLLDVGGKRLRRDTWNSGADDADIAFAGDEYLLVWLEIGPGTGGWTVMGQRLSLTLDKLGDVFPLVGYDYTQPEGPRVASNGTDFLVVWSEDRYYGRNHVMGTRVSHAGQVLDPAGLLIAEEGGYPSMYPDIAWNGSHYWVAYSREHLRNGQDIYATRVSPAGAVENLAGIAVANGPTSEYRPRIVAGQAGRLHAVWEDMNRSPGGDIVATTVTTTGAATRMLVNRGAPRQSRPRLAAGGDGSLLVLQSEVAGQTRIKAQRLDPAGNPRDAEPLLVAAGAVANPSVAWNGTLFMVVWEGGNRIYGRRLTADGVFVDAQPLNIIGGNMPDVAALGSDFLVVATTVTPPMEHVRFAQAMRVSGAGALLGSPIKLGSNHDVWPRVVAFGSRWLVVWEQNVTHDDARSTIVGAFVSADGAMPGRFAISDGAYGGGGVYDDTPHLAVSGPTALVVWADKNIFGRRIRADGTLLDNAAGLVISGAAEGQFQPQVAWDGARYHVAFLDHRNEAYPTQTAGDIYGTHVAATGQVLTPTGFPIASSPLPEVTPAVVAATGRVLYAFSRQVEHLPYANLRVAVRTWGEAGAVPGAPSGLTATRVSNGRVTLQWTGSNAVGYRVERRRGAAPWTTVAVVAGSQSAFSDDRIMGVQDYTYRVKAFNVAGLSPSSDEVNVR